MEANVINTIVLPVALVALVVALVVAVIYLIKILKNANTMLSDTQVHLNPMMANVKEMTDSAKPAVALIP